MWGTFVRIRRSAGTPRGENATPAAGSSSPSTFGFRPAATRRTSPSIVHGSPSPFAGATRSRTEEPAVAALSAFVLMRTFTPSASRRFRRIEAMSGSSLPSSWSVNSTTVTFDPNRRNAWAISTPIGPPPRISRRSGSFFWENTVSFVQYGTSAIPSTGGGEGLEPVAMIHALAVSRSPSMETVWSSTKRGDPNRTSAPSLQNRSGESCSWIVAMTERTRPMTAARETGGSATSGSPNSFARRARDHTPAVRISVFDGTQPKWRQSPPSAFAFSTSTVFAPNWAAPAAAVSPAAPPPRIPRSKSNAAMSSPFRLPGIHESLLLRTSYNQVADNFRFLPADYLPADY